MPVAERQEIMLPPQSEPSPAAESEVIEGEVTLELPPEPEATSPAAGQQVLHGEITVDVPPEQEAPAPRPLRRPYSLLVVATGHRHLDAEPARGAITFFNGLLSAQTIAAGTVLTGSSGVQVATERAAFIPAGNPPVYGQVTVPAHALLPGPQGNLRVGDIHQACCAPSVVADNLAPFTGGQDARDETVVAQADLDTGLLPEG